MLTTTKTAVFSVAALALVWMPSSASAQSNIRERVAAAVQSVQQACAPDVSKFCGNVSPGEGRVLVCMHAHDDQLSQSCQMSLYQVSRGLERALSRVERIADACWSDIQEKCGDAPRIGQCVMEKAASLSPSCQTVVAGLRQVQGAIETRGER
jgi:hypothetical protein